MLSSKPVKCGVAPVSANAVVNTGAGQVLSFGQELTYDCQLGCHVSSKRSRRNFSRKCHKGGMFACDFEQNLSHPHQSSFQSQLSGLLVTKPREVMDRLSSDVKIVQHFEPLEFHCFDGVSSGGTANHVLLTGSGICDAVGVFIIMQSQSARNLRQ